MATYLKVKPGSKIAHPDSDSTVGVWQASWLRGPHTGHDVFVATQCYQCGFWSVTVICDCGVSFTGRFEGPCGEGRATYVGNLSYFGDLVDSMLDDKIKGGEALSMMFKVLLYS